MKKWDAPLGGLFFDTLPHNQIQLHHQLQSIQEQQETLTALVLGLNKPKPAEKGNSSAKNIAKGTKGNAKSTSQQSSSSATTQDRNRIRNLCPDIDPNLKALLVKLSVKYLQKKGEMLVSGNYSCALAFANQR
jgi:hypothetical protein